MPQTAVASDTTAATDVLDNLQGTKLLPRELLADTHYCSDENIQDAAARGVELVGPVQCGSLIDKDVSPRSRLGGYRRATAAFKAAPARS